MKFSLNLNPIQDVPFWGCALMKGKKAPCPKIWRAYPTMTKLGTVNLTQSRSRKYINYVTHPLSFAAISIFFTIYQHFFVLPGNTDKNCILLHNSFEFLWVLKGVLIKIFAILMMLATTGLFTVMVLWNKGYDVIIFVHNVTNQILLRESNYILDVITWPKFGNSSISMREVIITSI